MPVAKIVHQCSLCFQPILAGSDYVRREITPWDEGSDHFWTFKAHHECNRVWNVVADEFDSLMPTCRSDWNDMVECAQEKGGA